MKQITITILLFVFTCAVAAAQSNKEDIAIIQNAFGKEKKDIVNDYIAIDQATRAPFWQLYDEYEKERKEIGLKRIKILEQYIAGYDSLTGTQADELMKGSFSTSIDLDKLRQKYYKKFSKVVGPLKAAKLMQIEDYLGNIVKLNIQDQIPFIDELNGQ